MKKTKLIIIIAVVILVAVALWAICFSYMSDLTRNSAIQGFVNDAKDFLSSDDDFTSKYGTLISLEPQDKDMLVEINTPETKEYYMDFYCTTNKGIFNIRVFLTLNEVWSYTYVDLSPDK